MPTYAHITVERSHQDKIATNYYAQARSAQCI